MFTFLANSEIKVNIYCRERQNRPKHACPNCVSFKGLKKQQGMEDIFAGTKINKQSKKVKLCVIKNAALKYNRAYLLRTEITKRYLNNRICWHCGVKTSTVTPSFFLLVL